MTDWPRTIGMRLLGITLLFWFPVLVVLEKARYGGTWGDACTVIWDLWIDSFWTPHPL